MANERSAYDRKLYLEKFKIEAVKPVIEKGDRVAEIVDRLGTTTLVCRTNIFKHHNLECSIATACTIYGLCHDHAVAENLFQ